MEIFGGLLVLDHLGDAVDLEIVAQAGDCLEDVAGADIGQSIANIAPVDLDRVDIPFPELLKRCLADPRTVDANESQRLIQLLAKAGEVCQEVEERVGGKGRLSGATDD